MRVSNLLVSIFALIIYIAIFIPLILPALNSMFIDWVNNSGDMFIQNYCVMRQQFNTTPVETMIDNTTTTTYTTTIISQAECTRYDFRPIVVFLFQLAVYFAIPLLLLFNIFRRR